MQIKGDVGELKGTSGLMLEGLKIHATKIGALESHADKQKGAIKVWGVIATAVATIAGSALSFFLKRHT